MDITKFNFPKPGICLSTNQELLAEAEKRGFLYGNTPYNDLFSTLFFHGGKIEFKKDVDQNFKKAALPYLRALVGSFEPKHEHKEAVCAMLLSELVEV